LPISGFVDISIYNILGQRVVTLINKRQMSGYHSINWDTTHSGKSLATGLYIARLQVKGDDGRIFTKSIKSILAK